MQKTFYDRLSDPFRRDPEKAARLNKINTLITRACYVIYPAILFWLAVTKDPRFFRAFLVPCISFIAVSLFRKACNAKRPYEIWDSPPVIPKETRGNSFPSRHTFSVFMIAMTAGYALAPEAGAAAAIILLAAGVFLAWIRVAAGVHFVKDTVTGAAIAVGTGLLFFFCI